MGKAFLTILVFISLGWIGYGSYQLIQSSNNELAPEYVFSELDGSLLIINRPEEITSFNLFTDENSNKYLEVLPSIDLTEYPNLKFYISKNLNKVVIERAVIWSKPEVDKLLEKIEVPFQEISFEGKFICLHSIVLIPNEDPKSIIYSGDKKASANCWQLEKPILLNDIYCKSDGTIEYKSKGNVLNAGKPVEDADLFAGYLPKNTSKYVFQEKFYASINDSVFKNSAFFEWCDKGFIQGEFLNQKFYLSDYKPGQIPSLVLLEKLQDIDSSYLTSDVKLFKGLKLTEDFPSNNDLSFYILAIDDKVVFSESKDICEKVALNYQLGQTLALSKVKFDEVYNDLPKNVNYRKITSTEAFSTTLSQNLNYTVYKNGEVKQATVNSSDMWSVKAKAPINFITLIPDHLREGNSSFISYNDGSYELLSEGGNSVWSGKLDSIMSKQPEVIDIYGNNRNQILFSVKNKVHLLDLNGNEVNGFPYANDSRISTSISTLTWKDTKRFVFGDESGSVTMLSNKGQELIVSKPFTSKVKSVFAHNESGILKYTAQSMNEIKKGDLEKSTNPVNSTWTKPNIPIYKLNKHPQQLIIENGAINLLSSKGGNSIHAGNATILKVKGDEIYLKESNTLYIKNKLGVSLVELKLPFNEVDDVQMISTGKNKFILILDGLENNVYLYNEFGEIQSGFPKEGSNFAQLSFNQKTNVLSVVTVVKNNVICYKLKSTL